MLRKIYKKRKKRWRKLLGIIFFILFLLVLFTFSYREVYSKKIYPGIKLGEFNIGGKSKGELENFLQSLVNKISKKGFTFTVLQGDQFKKAVVYPFIISPSDPDLSREIIKFKAEDTINECYKLGREGNLLSQIRDTWAYLLKKKQVNLQVDIDKEELRKALKDNFQSLEEPAKNARLLFKENSQILVVPEKSGFTFDYEGGIRELEQNLKELKNEQINLELVIDLPKVKKIALEKFIPEVKKIINLSPVTLSYQEKNWPISKKQIEDWLEFNKKNSKTEICFNKDKMKLYLEEIAKEMEIKPKEAKFQIADGRVSEFQIAKDGLFLNYEKTCQKIENELIYRNNRKIEICVEIVKTETVLENINNLGIKELIGQGISDFSGSPQNRRHNIKIGADSLNGLLIKPDEEFSLVKAIGKVDASRGYLPELVIKGDRTVPEYGGGLCQIATTAFRVALDAGVPITERRPHSYRVFYYEPAGTDATVYNPHPDLRFINDTGNYVLWQSKIEGNSLIFEFWGSFNGRKVEVTKPRIFNITSPGPTKIIETGKLAPGEKKCIERAHKGADTEFTRIITYQDGEIKKEVWKSHYRDWPEVCLIGKELDVEDEEDGGNEEVVDEESEEGE